MVFSGLGNTLPNLTPFFLLILTMAIYQKNFSVRALKVSEICQFEPWHGFTPVYLTQDESASVTDDTLVSGELWMNLDGNISPVCVNILPLVSTSPQKYNSNWVIIRLVNN
jgi:hypothetical protein